MLAWIYFFWKPKDITDDNTFFLDFALCTDKLICPCAFLLVLMDHYLSHEKQINIGSALSKRKDDKRDNNTASGTSLEYATQVSEVLCSNYSGYNINLFLRFIILKTEEMIEFQNSVQDWVSVTDWLLVAEKCFQLRQFYIRWNFRSMLNDFLVMLLWPSLAGVK